MSTSNVTFGEDEQEYLLEREAISEFDGGLSREDARKLAYRCYVNKFRPEFAHYYPLPGKLPLVLMMPPLVKR